MSPSACGSRDRMNGNADSGQMRCVTPPASSPGAPRSDRSRYRLTMASLFSGANDGALRTFGCISRSLTPGAVALAGAASRHGAKRGDRRERRGPRAIVGADLTPPSPTRHKRRGRRKHGDRDEGEAVQADCRGDLSQRQIGAERHAEVVPWKAGEEEAASPFARAQPEGERKHPPRRRKTREGRRARIRRPGKKPAPPAGRPPRAAAPTGICPRRRDRPPRSTTGRRGNSRIRATSRPRRPLSAAPRLLEPRLGDPSISQTAAIMGTAIEREQAEGRQGESADRPRQQRDRPPAPSRRQDNACGRDRQAIGERR